MPICLQVICVLCEQRCSWVMTSSGILSDLFHLNRQLNSLTIFWTQVSGGYLIRKPCSSVFWGTISWRDIAMFWDSVPFRKVWSCKWLFYSQGSHLNFRLYRSWEPVSSLIHQKNDIASLQTYKTFLILLPPFKTFTIPQVLFFPTHRP